MRPWVPPAAGGVAFLLVTAGLLIAPAPAGRLAEDIARAPGSWLAPSARPAYEEWVTRSVESGVRFFALGDPDDLIRSRLHLTNSTPAPHDWYGHRSLTLAWTDLGHPSIRYEVRLGPAGGSWDAAMLVGTSEVPGAVVEVPADGRHLVWVRPVAVRPGTPTAFGPFLVDASPPAAPTLAAPQTPPGYRFQIVWNASADDSDIQGYEVQRRRNLGAWSTVAFAPAAEYVEDQIGNGDYHYRVRAVNGAGVPSAWSAEVAVAVRAPMQNPGPGVADYGIHANYTGFIHLWDLSDPDRYLSVDEVPDPIRNAYLGSAPSIETENETLQAIVRGLVGTETNTLRIAERIFAHLFDHTEYDAQKRDADFDPDDPGSGLQRAGETLDRGAGICGDLAVLYITLLRIAQVPARPVHGYLDNPRAGVGGFHMWVEVYVGPRDDAHAWMPVDVSGVNGAYRPEWLFAYFGLFNPDYLALGTERDYDRFDDGQWNTWARYGYKVFANDPRPTIEDRTRVVEYEQELGRLFFDVETRRTTYVPCRAPNPNDPENPCPGEPAPGGFTRYYGMKGMAKKRIDYGAVVSSPLPGCVRVELRAPWVDEAAAATPDQSTIYRVYSSSSTVLSEPLDASGWVRFLDGSRRTECA